MLQVLVPFGQLTCACTYRYYYLMHDLKPRMIQWVSSVNDLKWSIGQAITVLVKWNYSSLVLLFFLIELLER